MTQRKALLIGSAIVLAIGTASAAPVDTIRTRIAGFRELGAAFKGINDGLRGEPQLVLIQQSARQVVNASRQQYNWFPVGTGPQPGVKSAAKPDIWAKPVPFKAAQDAFAREAAAMQRVAVGGNAAALRVQAKKLGATCKSCHDQFRNKVD
jgi:cytochrome c556